MPEDGTKVSGNREAHDAAENSRARLRVEDRRHWARAAEDEPPTEEAEPADAPPATPTLIDGYRARAEAAERTLQDYIAAFRQAQAEQEQFRTRLQRDVERKVELKFGEIVGDFLECVDDLDLALAHVAAVPEAEALARGVALVRDRFVSVLERSGVERLILDGTEFDPHVAEALRVDPVDDTALHQKVTATLRPGYRLGERVIRPARVAVGRYSG